MPIKTKKHVVKGKWDKRALFYNNKMAAAKLLDIAEIVRDLYSASGMQRSYSERKIYDDAFSKIVREVACVTGVAIEKVMSLTEKILDGYNIDISQNFKMQEQVVQVMQLVDG